MSNNPYVYKLTHKVTGEFYIGHRWANKYPAHLDFGVHYFSSSAKVKRMGFDNFNWEILFEATNKDRKIAADDAYDVENEIIESVFGDNLCLNGQFRNRAGALRFKHDPTGVVRSAETKEKIAAANRGKKAQPEVKQKMSSNRKGKSMNHPTEVIAKMADNARKQMAKKYRLISPGGNIFEGTDLKKFCMEHDLNQGNMASVCRGTRAQHKGWVGVYVE